MAGLGRPILPARPGTPARERFPLILDDILAEKEEEVRRLRSRGGSLLERASAAPEARDFAGCLRQEREVAVIAEFKRRAPSAGDLAVEAEVEEVASAYAAGGAAAVSVLTDGPFFGGGLEDLRRARAAVSVPLLRKDFLVDPLQVVEARAAGADAVLLIVAAASRNQLEELHAAAREMGMSALVEVHGPEELEEALRLDPRVVGVNARDLRTFDVDLDRAAEILARVPADRVAVGESGVHGPGDVRRLGEVGADAVLVGTALMRRGGADGLPPLVGVERPADSPRPA